MTHHHGLHGFKWYQIIGLAIAGLVGAVVFGFLFGYFIMLLWNWLMPTLFKLGTINYWQAVGLALLARLLLGSHCSHHGGHDHHGHHGKHHHWHGCGPDHDSHDWEYYDGWWESEGKQTFKAYIERHKAEGSTPDSDHK